MKEIQLSSEISIENNKSNEDETNNLIEKMDFDKDEMNDSFLLDIPKKKKENNKCKCKCFSQLPFMFYFFIILIIFTILLIVRYISLYINHKPNFRINEIPWVFPELNDRIYQDYIFDNGLEVLLIQDPKFDMDGGAIVIESGYLDYPYDEGIASFACNLLTHLIFKDTKNIPTVEDYFGTYLYEAEDHFTIFRFDILNNGFKKFLSLFSQILNIGNFNISSNIDIIKEEIDTKYNNSIDIPNQENHLLEYLVYDFKDNETGYDILPIGNNITLNKYNDSELQEKVQEYIKHIIDPKKIKIVLFSKYKFLISAKYMKKYFNYLTTMDPPQNNNYEKKYELKDFKKAQILFIKSDFNEPNYIKIIYFIDKKINETYSELFYKNTFFNYIVDFFQEKKKGSLYYLLTNSHNFNIKAIDIDNVIILKSKIKFIIHIELNCLKNINDIIFITYQFMHKIVKQAIGNNIQFDRYKELKDLGYQAQKYTEKTFDTIELAKNNAKNLIDTKFVQKYYFYGNCLPWNDTNNILEIINNETFHYFDQLRPENSVVIIGIKEKDIDKVTCNNSSKFYLNCTDLKDDNMKETKYYDIYYKNYFFNPSELEEYLDINNTANITFLPNRYKSKNNESFIGLNEKIDEPKNIRPNKPNQFYFGRNVNFNIPRVFISLNLLHPFLRPMNNETNITKCYYFQIIEMFSAIKRKINYQLADAIRAKNEITFGQTENYLYINIFCYNDVAYEIVLTIKKIIFDTKWESTDFISNNEIYKNEAYDDFFNFEFDIKEVSRYYFYSQLKNNLYNKYEFFPEQFEVQYYNKCLDSIDIDDLTTFLVNGFIYGFYTKEEAKNISKLFQVNNLSSTSFNELLQKVNNNEVNLGNFSAWIKKINELEEDKEVNISTNLYNNSNEKNYGVRYVSFPKSELLDISLFESVFTKIQIEDHSRMLNFEMFMYNNIYFELILYSKDKKIIPYDKFVENEWRMILQNYDKFNVIVDNIGNRYFYIRKNFVLTLIKQQTSLNQRAIDLLKEVLYDGSVLDPEIIMNKYNERYNDQPFDFEELNHLIVKYSNISKNKKIDVHTIGY